MIVSGNKDNFKVFIIDFGLGFISPKIEDKAVDLHLIKQALEAKHFKIISKILMPLSSLNTLYCVIAERSTVELTGRKVLMTSTRLWVRL